LSQNGRQREAFLTTFLIPGQHLECVRKLGDLPVSRGWLVLPDVVANVGKIALGEL
jgi:hypothetical protein